MELSCVQLKANSCVGQAKGRVFSSGESGIWGDGLGAGLVNKPCGAKLGGRRRRRRMSFSCRACVGVSRAGTALSVLTSDAEQETRVN